MLVQTKYILAKANYVKKKVSLECIIQWGKLDTIPSIANGPNLSELSVNMPWSGFLKLLIEITLIGLNKDPEQYVDSEVSYENKKRKHVKAKKTGEN